MDRQSDALAGLLSRTRALTVLTGAGVSTDSGIPDYRDRNGAWKHGPPPIQYAQFAGSREFRRRYWARSYAGWPRFGAALPNTAHFALATMETTGRLDTLITQNVDRLHSRAGSRRVIDLHGDLRRVRCMDCGARSSRQAFQAAIRDANPDWHARALDYRPDGDARLAERNDADFELPGCDACGGRIRPDVVMFGESVPRERVDESMAAVERADALLVAGSSLMVYSGYRFARRAHEAGKPVVIINRGRTRADELATIRIDGDCSKVLSGVLAMMTGSSPPPDTPARNGTHAE